MRAIVTGVAAWLALSACSPTPKVETPTTTPTAEEPGAKPAAPVQKPADNPDAAEVARGNNSFALSLYRELGKKEGNLFLSPYSVSTALAMTYAGAKGDTASEMRRTLGFTLPDEKLHPAFSALQVALNAPGKPYQLRVANRLWGAKGAAFADEYLRLTKAVYDAPLEPLDFAKDAESSREAINAWVAEKTQGKIKDLLPRGSIKPNARLVLTNAIYFKGNWAKQFKKENTKDEPFQVSAKKKLDVPMMHQTLDARHGAADGVKVLELPYAGEELSMLVLLPEKADGLADLEKKLTPENLDKWLAALTGGEVNLTLPRFTFTAEYALKETLARLGMAKLFSDAADLSGMGPSLKLDQVFHKAFVDVNEEGTEAAAATGGIAVVTAVPMPFEFRADHPFVFLIRDTRSGGILFLGRVENPKL
jgi:serine protease inhibitor